MTGDATKKQTINLQIGQIVYILSDKAEAIVPAIVSEELVHKKLDGNSVSWKVAIGPAEKKKLVSSNEISGEIYSSLEDIRDVMMERLSNFVSVLIGKAEKRTEAWYGKQLPKKSYLSTDKSGKIDPSALLDIIDGREKGKQFIQSPGQEVHINNVDLSLDQQNKISPVRAPINQGPLKKTNSVSSGDPRDQLRNRLLELAQVPEEETMTPDTNNDEFLITEDGRKIPVKYNTNE